MNSSWSAYFFHKFNSLPEEVFLDAEGLEMVDSSDCLNMLAFLEDKRWLFSTAGSSHSSWTD